MTTLAIPTVHINGTSQQMLMDQLGNAIDAVHEAGRKLAAACPNGRDYYVQGGDAIKAALDQHEARMAKLKSIATDLESIMEAVADQ